MDLPNVHVCLVTAAVNSDETVDVTYVDFGNSEKLPFSEVRKLPDMFLRLPKQVRALKYLSTVSDWYVMFLVLNSIRLLFIYGLLMSSIAQ